MPVVVVVVVWAMSLTGFLRNAQYISDVSIPRTTISEIVVQIVLKFLRTNVTQFLSCASLIYQ